MHLILRQTGATDPEEIEITGSLFAVGRYEPPFTGFDRTRVARLSKRHARIFEQDSRIYVADLGSTNGTHLNGRPVQGDPQILVTGDVLSFGGLEYELEAVGRTDPLVGKDAEIRLVLTPEHDKEILEPLIISSFPFLVNKYSDAFSRYKEQLPDDLAYISRRHAHFFLRNSKVYLEDLGSTNGTFVSGELLDEHARLLEDGDTIAFGGDQFVYRAHILDSAMENTTEFSEVIEGVEDPDRTIFIDSPTSFVDIYIGSPEADGIAEDEHAAAAEDEQSSAPASRTRVGRGVHFLRQIGAAIFGDRWMSTTTRWTLATVTAVLSLAAAYSYWTGSQLRNLDRLLADSEYVAAAIAANDYLATRPDSSAVRLVATEALLRHIAHEWMGFIDRGAFAEAEDLLRKAIEIGASNPDDDRLLSLLQWATGAERFLDRQDKEAALNQLLEDVGVLDELIGGWESAKRLYTRELLQASASIAEFKPIRENILSNVRRLQILERDLRAVQLLSEDLDAALDSNNAAAVDEAINAYASVAGRVVPATLGDDAARMKGAFEALKDDRYLVAYDWLTQSEFATRPFADRATKLIGHEVPDAATAARYRNAMNAWQEGRTEEAFAVLATLGEERWGSEASSLAQHYRSLLEDFEALVSIRGSENYDQRLIGYRDSLDKDADRFLVDLLAADFQTVVTAASTEAESRLTEAEAAWSVYEGLGGIDSDSRLEDRLSERFKQLAASLSSARLALQDARSSYTRTGQTPSMRWQTLHSNVCKEINEQREALENLKVVGTRVRAAQFRLMPSACD